MFVYDLKKTCCLCMCVYHSVLTNFLEHFGKYTCLLPYQELDEKIDFLLSVYRDCTAGPGHKPISLEMEKKLAKLENVHFPIGQKAFGGKTGNCNFYMC